MSLGQSLSCTQPGLSRHKSFSGLEGGNKVVPFDITFDDHFNVRSRWMASALRGETPKKGTTEEKFAERCSTFPEYATRPEAWGIKVKFISQLYELIESDLTGYSTAHCSSAERHNEHVCMVQPCEWCHEGAVAVSRKEAHGLKPMIPNMHLVVQRYVKPWTSQFTAGFSLMMNAGHIARKSSVLPEEFCLTGVFISHCWNERFKDFVKTLENAFDPDTIVWVCSFALDQNSNIENQLSELVSCPFAKALNYAPRVVAVTDHTTEAFQRSWVVLEAELAREWGKKYDISLPEDGDVALWHGVGQTLSELNVANCKSSREEDRKKILDFAQTGLGGIEGLNRKVQGIAREAMNRAQIMALATSGDIDNLNMLTAVQVRDWRSIRGMTATHIAAWHCQVATAIEILAKTDDEHLNLIDNDGRTPLSLASEHGAISSVYALLRVTADPNKCSKQGISPLHYAALSGHASILSALLGAGANLEAKCKYHGTKGNTAVILAARAGNAAVIRALVRHNCNLDSRTDSGRTALTQAANWGWTDAVAALLQGGADVNALTTEKVGRSALMVAVVHSRYAVACTLLGSGADVQLKSTECKTAMDYCQEDLAKVNPNSAVQMQNLLERFVAMQQADTKREDADPAATTLECLVSIFAKCDIDGSGLIPRETLIRTLDGLSMKDSQKFVAFVFPDESPNVSYEHFLRFCMQENADSS